MKPQELLEIMHIAENLKNNTRHSWTSTGRRESVAEHSWRLSMMAFFMADEFPNVDINKVIKMCIFHDMGEAFTGDIPAFHKTSEDEKKEEACIQRWITSLPAPYQEEVKNLFEEMNAQQTREAKLYKAMDKLECLVQHNEADISTWLPLEYELNLTYGKEQVAFSEYMTKLKQIIDEESLRKIAAAKE